MGKHRERIIRLATLVKMAEKRLVIHVTSGDLIQGILSQGLLSGKRQRRDEGGQWGGWNAGAPFTQTGVYFFSTVDDLNSSDLIDSIVMKSGSVGIVVAVVETQDKEMYVDEDYFDNTLEDVYQETFDEDDELDKFVSRVTKIYFGSGPGSWINRQAHPELKKYIVGLFEKFHGLKDELGKRVQNFSRKYDIRGSWHELKKDKSWLGNKDLLGLIEMDEEIEKVKGLLYNVLKKYRPNVYKDFRVKINKDVGYRGSNRIVGVALMDGKGGLDYKYLERSALGGDAREMISKCKEGESLVGKLEDYVEAYPKMEYSVAGDNVILKYYCDDDFMVESRVSTDKLNNKSLQDLVDRGESHDYLNKLKVENKINFSRMKDYVSVAYIDGVLPGMEPYTENLNSKDLDVWKIDDFLKRGKEWTKVNVGRKQQI